ncbi:MAG: hypothetical protein KGZ96_00475 [Clostridia bacterium]|nr:hypothetical protein [Clostridia bacterium]
MSAVLANLFRKGESKKRETSPQHSCHQCGLKLSEPEVIRCPRCFALVMQHQCGGCGKCSH